MNVYIENASQVSIQSPLCDDWMSSPLMPEERLCRIKRPDFKQFLSPAISRRMGTILKCALTAALQCVSDDQRTHLSGILTGTGLGSVENTENFLLSMLEGEVGLSPSNFMQSTHNTIGSQIAILFKCHGYNITFSHRGTSFDSALMNAMLKFKLGEFSTALVNGVDEMTEKYFQLFDQIGYWKKEITTLKDFMHPTSNGTFAGENCVSFLLSSTLKENSLCELCDTDLLYRPTDTQILNCIDRQTKLANIDHIDGIIIGSNGDLDNDNEYFRLCNLIQPKTPRIIYKHLFGESFTISAMGLYVAAKCLKNKYIPAHITINSKRIDNPKSILILNHFKKTDYSITLLKTC